MTTCRMLNILALFTITKLKYQFFVLVLPYFNYQAVPHFLEQSCLVIENSSIKQNSKKKSLGSIHALFCFDCLFCIYGKCVVLF